MGSGEGAGVVWAGLGRGIEYRVTGGPGPQLGAHGRLRSSCRESPRANDEGTPGETREHREKGGTDTERQMLW